VRQGEHYDCSVPCGSACAFAVESPACREHVGDVFRDDVDFNGAFKANTLNDVGIIFTPCDV
jgi:hypothetical protein